MGEAPSQVYSHLSVRSLDVNAEHPMPAWSRLLILPVALAGLFVGSPTPALSDCTVNTAQVCYDSFVSADSIFYGHHWCSPLSVSSASVSWELARGKIWLDAQYGGLNVAPGIAVARVSDLFKLAGGPPVVPVAFDAILSISLARAVGFQTCAPFQVSFGVAGQPDSVVYSVGGCTSIQPKYLTLHLLQAPTVPFELFAHAQFQTYSAFTMAGSAGFVLSFPALPPRGIVTS